MSLSSLGLDAFYACAQTGHFTRAAEKLHITQSALSQRIQHLESDLQTALFIRQKSGIRLTAAGERLLKYCMAKDALESEALSGLRNSTELAGHLRIGGFSSIMRSVVLPALEEFLQKNKQVRVQLVSREMDELPTMLRRGEIDFMILNDEFNREGVLGELLGVEHNVLCEKKDYQGGEVYLDHDENDQVTQRYLKMIKNSAKYERHYLDDVYGLIDGVKYGLGRAVLPKHLIKTESRIRIANRKVLEIPVWIHYYEQPFYSRLQIASLEAVRAVARRLLG
jgi:DNA-binding transcriptional LysR family regulator